jgi:hypothetical protein
VIGNGTEIGTGIEIGIDVDFGKPAAVAIGLDVGLAVCYGGADDWSQPSICSSS